MRVTETASPNEVVPVHGAAAANEVGPVHAMVERAVLTFDERCKSRLLVKLEGGEHAALIVERGRVLRSGERLRSQDGRAIDIIAADESLLEAVSEDPLLIAKAAYHLGNRHVAVQLMSGSLRFPADHVLAEMVAGLGLQVNALVAPFEPEGGAYGRHHAHGSEAPPIRPKIHSFRPP
jgi:urease accessory protein